MALRNQPYIPLYVDDYLTDEKLNMCSASTQGVYIKILCILHKQDEYGKLLLKQKEKQNESMCYNFATKFAKLLPFTFEVIYPSIEELIEENVLFIDGDFICQKRMIKDNSLSIVRSNNGKKGGEKTQSKNKKNNNLDTNFALAKDEASSVNVNENKDINKKENSIDNNLLKTEKLKKEKTSKKENYTDEDLQTFEVARKYYKGVRKGLQTEFANFTKHKDWKQCLPLLLPAMLLEAADKKQTFDRNGFQQQWKNFSTWINQRCWETEYPNLTQQEIDNANNIKTDANGNVTIEEPLPRPTRAEIMEHPEKYPEGTISRCGGYIVRNRTWYNI